MNSGQSKFLLRCTSASERLTFKLPQKPDSAGGVYVCVHWEIPILVSTELAAMGVSRVCLLLLLVELSLCSPAFSYSHRLWTRQNADCTPTPRNLRVSFLSNCTGIGLESATCDRVWMNFTQAFAGRDPTTVVARLV